MEKGICKLCGKEGTFRQALSRGNTFWTLDHYCPVKAKRRKEKKAAEELESVKRVIRYGVENCNVSTSDVFNKYPYTRNEDIFAPWAKEEIAYQDGYKRLQAIYFNFLKDNMRRPNKREYKKMLKEF